MNTKSSYFAIDVQESRLEYHNLDQLDVAFPAGSSNVIHIESQAYSEGYQPHNEVNKSQGPRKIHIGAYLKIHTKYSLNMFFEASSIRIVQSSQVELNCTFAQPLDKPPVGGGPRSLYYINNTSQLRLKADDKTLTDTYSITVDRKNRLQLVKADESLDDRSDSEPQQLTPTTPHNSSR
ncbi:uncharacterized protein BO66DRAFT_443843 [Aspergillus aculeatinus CBS 121060]|uniref:Uncharacterized protein n=1 Tax=Aspergillus aculeatinus CBS 121060 TaxID=1448322 RepID=A0ACD1GTG1_9EURO|nr:hypothetical protein BO66DRAFT_443843 [Aspergillus aculeatinus CBS 121060]RAH64552.1 hypothetical protein BO66DRAFT_443843 [Aspergillus aculeatinus CBS 121060]